MAFGYNLQVTPLQTATFYNAVANNGKMMRPYLLNAVKEEGELIKEYHPKILLDKVCSDETIKQLQICLEAVCTDGTAKELFKNSSYQVAGKTGTALVANGNRGYADKIYQTSFAGYFPANNPQYTIVVVIKNKPEAVLHYGATVAGPVFKEIADRLYTTYVKQANYITKADKKVDSSAYNYVGATQDFKQLSGSLKLGFIDSNYAASDLLNMNTNKQSVFFTGKSIDGKTMPQLKGMGLKDVVILCENMGLKVNTKGKGKVVLQSLVPGQSFAKGQILNIALN